MIKKNIDEFYNSPKNISQEKVTFLKNYFYPQINEYKAIKRENFQIGVNSNPNILFFRDKNNKHQEIILYLTTNKKFINFRKNISSTIYYEISYNIDDENNNIYYKNNSIDEKSNSKESLVKNSINTNSMNNYHKDYDNDYYSNYINTCKNNCTCIII